MWDLDTVILLSGMLTGTEFLRENLKELINILHITFNLANPLIGILEKFLYAQKCMYNE